MRGKADDGGPALVSQLTRLDFVLRETLTYRYPSPANPSYIVRAPPKVNSIVTANANISPDPNNDPTAFAVLYQNEPVSFAMSGMVPTSHCRVTVRTAKVRFAFLRVVERC